MTENAISDIIKSYALRLRKEFPLWRWGQCVFNAAHQIVPDRADRLRLSAADPYYRDANVDRFLEEIDRGWYEAGDVSSVPLDGTSL